MASVQSPSKQQDIPQEYNPESTPATTTEEAGDAPPNSSSPEQPRNDDGSITSPKKSSYHAKPILVYSRRHILKLSESPLVQRPQGMPALKDWFGEWAEQHNFAQGKKDGTEANGTTGNRRFPRREQEDGNDASSRPSFRSTLSQPSQMGNFKHQSLRGDLTRGGTDRGDKDTDKDGHDRLRSLSDMYDRDRLGLPLTLPPLIRSQQRDSIPGSSISGSTTTAGRLATRETRTAENGRRGENGRKKGGDSVDWRRGAEVPRGGKENRNKSERDGSPEVERPRRDRSASREKWTERGEPREGRREAKTRDTDEKDGEKDRRTRLRDLEGQTERTARPPADERRKGREEGDGRRERGDKAREHPDTKRDRELREGWTTTEERGGRRGTGRRGGEEERDTRRQSEKDKEPAWMDDYVPEAGAPKAGIFGGRVEGIDDEIQAWKKKQGGGGKNTSVVTNGTPATEKTAEPLPRDGVIGGKTAPTTAANEDQAKAAEDFLFGLMNIESSKSLSHTPTPAKTPEPGHLDAKSSARKSPAPILPPSSAPIDPAKVDPAVISLTPLGVSKPDASTAIPPSTGGFDTNRDTLQTVSTSIARSSPGPLSSTSSAFSSLPGQLGSSALNTENTYAKASATPSSSPFNPPQQSRVLALTQSSQAAPGSNGPRAGVIGQPPATLPHRVQSSPHRVPSRGDSITEQATYRIHTAETTPQRSAFSPFDSSSVLSPTARQPGDERNPRMSPQTLMSPGYDAGQTPSPNSSSTYAIGKGSRFAKFWDGKTKEGGPPGFGHQPPPPPQSVSPSIPHQQQQQQRQPEHMPPNGFHGNAPNTDNIQEMLAILQNSQAARLNASSGLHRQHPSHLQALHESQIPHHQPQPQHHFSNPSTLLDNHQYENRPFVPDGMVPGLRPSNRAREGLYANDMIDDSPFTVQPRLQPAPQPHFERQPAQMPQLFNNQGPGAGLGMGMGGGGGGNRMFQQQHQPPFRVEPNAMNMNAHGGMQQRLPPGLANLGGRPPHDPNGFNPNIGGIMGMQGPGGAGHQQPFNQFGGNAGGLGNFVAQQQRGPLPLQMLNNNNVGTLAASGHPDFTVQPHPIVRGPPPRGMHGGFASPGAQVPLQGPLGMRQQQHIPPQMLPPHLQQQQQLPGGLGMHGNPQAQNEHLLSMLMSGLGPRE
ncbi:hypothetical protein M422DRAFT_67309 [Sphaerobolus stellatus SS14]|uniref:Uncharacterized protein n=1 Tax=Sphaerobolus stellatus (strain SS14) TaxID=990650 RepID=A0A0C9VDN0_SPHS4|nr:hypothetical protein M422DRAFT_67309 [Sphaerobolus stellatus SS14]